VSSRSELIDTFGADTARLFTMFAGPPEQTLAWNDSGVEGAHRFLRVLWGFGAKNAPLLQRPAAASSGASRGPPPDLRREVHLLLRQVSHDYDRMQYNTVVSGAMKMLNAMEAFKTDGRRPGRHRRVARGHVVCCCARLYPACAAHHPRVVGRPWALRVAQGDLLDAPWPAVDEAALVQDEIELVLQVNGKTARRGARAGQCRRARPTIEAAALAHARSSPSFSRRPAREEGGWWCRAGWSTSSSDRTHGLLPSRCRRHSIAAICWRPWAPAWPLAAAASPCGRPPQLAFGSIALVGFASKIPAGRRTARAHGSTAALVRLANAGPGRSCASSR
jgi:leucyl-tRNA synthetase